MNLNTLNEFRHAMYHSFGKAKDALFNLLDARGVISTTERAALMARVRNIACRTAGLMLEQEGVPGHRDGREVRP